jgi:hypothetical protein
VGSGHRLTGWLAGGRAGVRASGRASERGDQESAGRFWHGQENDWGKRT